MIVDKKWLERLRVIVATIEKNADAELKNSADGGKRVLLSQIHHLTGFIESIIEND